MLKNLVLAVAAMLALSALGSCGTQNIGAAPEFGSGNLGSSAFKLDVMDETFDYGATAQDISLAVSTETDTHLVVDVTATGAEGLKGLYFTLEYDATRYRPMVVEPAPAMGERGDLINLMAVERPGRMQYGQTLVHQEYQAGFTGTATLAQVSFRKEATPMLRTASAAPTSASSAVSDLAFDDGTDTLTWSYAFQGDYGQDGTVSVADLQPLGANFNAISPGGAGIPFPFDTARSQIDGDSNGVLAVTDLTPIGANINRDMFGGFHIYASADPADYPATPTGANGGGANDIGVVGTSPPGLGDAALNSVNKATERLRFSFTIAAPTANDVYWIRAEDAVGAQGITSNMTGGDPAALPVLSLDPLTPANSGDGSAGNPYNMTAGQDYNFIVLDNPVDQNDVSGTAVFNVTPPSAGSFAGNVLTVDAGHTGGFTVSASYNGVPASNTISCTVATVVTPAPFIDKDPADNDWDTVTGSGADETSAYILRTDTFNAAYTLDFTLLATGGDAAGPVIPNGDLTWDAFPPFTVADSAAFSGTGVFTVWNFTSGYVFAQDATLQNSNQLHIAVNSLPN